MAGSAIIKALGKRVANKRAAKKIYRQSDEILEQNLDALDDVDVGPAKKYFSAEGNMRERRVEMLMEATGLSYYDAAVLFAKLERNNMIKKAAPYAAGAAGVAYGAHKLSEGE